MHADEEKWFRTGTSGRRAPDPGVVVAARDGDARALDALLADVFPLVYNIVGRALDGHADVDDVVQETLLRVVRGLSGLREPEAFRSWLVAIAVRQVRDRQQERHRAFAHNSALDALQDLADPAADFVADGIRSLGLAERRRVVTSAMRWLDADNRTLLALWWLEEIGELERPDLAAALGLSAKHAAVRVLRMKEQMQTACMVVKALQAEPGCRKLREITQGWDLTPSPLWRKRVSRHVRECDECWHYVGDLLPVDSAVRALPLLPVPAALAQHWALSSQAGHTMSTQTGHGVHSTNAAHSNGSVHAANGSGHSHNGALLARHSRRLITKRPRGLFGIFTHGGLVPIITATVIVGAGVGTVLAVQPSGAPVAKPTIAAPALPASPSPSPSPSAKASPSPSPSPSPSVKPSPSKVPVAPPVQQPISGPKKGVSVWTFNGVNTALAESKASWYYTWSTSHSGITTPSGATFTPMIWGAGSVTAANLAQAKAAGPYLLGFNEPDMAAQSNMTVDQALSLWPQLMATGDTLGSPAVATGGATPGGWLDRFMSGAQTKGYRVDFITLHWYGGDFTTTDAVSQLKSYIQAVYDRYHKPIWLTEYALINFSNGTSYPTDQQQAAFITASAQMLASLPYVQRYAWFALPASDTGPSTGLFHSGPTITPEGQAFESAAGG